MEKRCSPPLWLFPVNLYSSLLRLMIHRDTFFPLKSPECMNHCRVPPWFRACLWQKCMNEYDGHLLMNLVRDSAINLPQDEFTGTWLPPTQNELQGVSLCSALSLIHNVAFTMLLLPRCVYSVTCAAVPTFLLLFFKHRDVKLPNL